MKCKIRDLSDSDYKAVMVESFDPERQYETLKKISGAYIDKLKKKAKRMKQVSTVDVANELPGKPTSSASSAAQSWKSVSAGKVCY